MASLYSESELAARQHIRPDEPPVAHWSKSAEGVALGLLRQFNDKALPRDSELQWLVSEQDAPQSVIIFYRKILF
jgi:run domain Beclin-1 interacting cysteine-rich containing protein